jgi:hypothetical protein
MADEDFDIFDWPKSSLGSKISKVEESLQCPICGGVFGEIT